MGSGPGERDSGTQVVIRRGDKTISPEVAKKLLLSKEASGGQRDIHNIVSYKLSPAAQVTRLHAIVTMLCSAEKYKGENVDKAESYLCRCKAFKCTKFVQSHSMPHQFLIDRVHH